MSHIILQRYANREIRIGAQSIAIASKKKGDKALDFANHKFSQKILDYQVSQANLSEGFELGFDRRGCAIAIPYTLEKHSSCEARLDIISEFQERSLKVKNKGGWGFAPKITAFGKSAKHKILEGGSVLDKKYGKNIVEVTCTIPGSGREVFRTISDWSGWIMNRITQVVRDSKHDPGWFYVWEFQKRRALHLHFAIGCSTLPDAIELAEKIKLKWFQVLLELQEKCGVDVFRKNAKWTWRDKPEKWQSHVLPVYKSVAAYFSKYLGKHTGKNPTGTNRFCPARWWGSSRSVKRGIEDARSKFSIEVPLQNVGMAITFLSDVLSSFNPIKNYRYDFDLGTSRSGADLGGGWREISYFEDKEFLSISEILVSLVEYITQTWGVYADIPELPTQTSKYKLTI